MKVLQINATYDKSSVGKIVHDIKLGLDQLKIDNYVIFGRGANCFEDDSHVFKIGSDSTAHKSHIKALFTGLYYSCSVKNTKRILAKIHEIKPDIIHIHCLNGFFIDVPYFINEIKRAGMASILTLHAEFMYTGTCGYANDCQRFIKGCHDCPYLHDIDNNFMKDNVAKSNTLFANAFSEYKKFIAVGVSPWVSDRASTSLVLSHRKHGVVLNGVDCDVFKRYDRTPWSKKFANRQIILNVTSNFSFPEKGGSTFLEIARRHIKNKKLLFVVAGTANSIDAPENVVFIGRLNSQEELAQLYSASSLTLLPNKRETFLMAVPESLCCGTPVVGYCAGGPESIALSKYSSFVKYGDIDALSNMVDRWIVKSKTVSHKRIEKEACAKYSKEEMVKNYIHEYEKLLK